MQKHKKRKTCKKSNKIKKITFAPAISTSYLLNITLDVFSIDPQDSFLEIGSVVGVLHIDLVGAPLLLQLVVHRLHGLLRPKSKAVHLSFQLHELNGMSLEQVDLNKKYVCLGLKLQISRKLF